MTKNTVLKLMRKLGHVPVLPWDDSIEGMELAHCGSCHKHVVLWDPTVRKVDPLAQGEPLSKECGARRAYDG